MMTLRPATIFALLPLLPLTASSACSLTLNTKLPTVRSLESPVCSDRRTAPILDFIAAGSLVLLATTLDEGRTGTLLAGLGFGAAGIYGYAKTNRCRHHRARWETANFRRIQERHRTAFANGGGVDLSDAAADGPAPPAEGPPSEPDVADRPELTGENDPAEARLVGSILDKSGKKSAQKRPEPNDPTATLALGKQCAAGGACPPGSVCDPLRHLCLKTKATGTEGGRCDNNRSCDRGLYCGEKGRCRPGRVGREGGHCRRDKSCDDGFVCASHTCVRKAQPLN